MTCAECELSRKENPCRTAAGDCKSSAEGDLKTNSGEKQHNSDMVHEEKEILMDLNVDAVDDISLKEEDDYIAGVKNGGYDVIFADPCMEQMIPGFEGNI